MKRYAAMLSSAILASCALVGGIQYGGQSAAFGGDNVLRNDVAKVIKQWESAAFLCQNIKAIDAKISDVKRVKGRMQSEEVWTVQAAVRCIITMCVCMKMNAVKRISTFRFLNNQFSDGLKPSNIP